MKLNRQAVPIRLPIGNRQSEIGNDLRFNCAGHDRFACAFLSAATICGFLINQFHIQTE
jgi:hypothetical protein